MSELKFRFETQEYQTKAVQSVVDVFQGQGNQSASVEISEAESLNLGISSNQLSLSPEAVFENIQKVKKQNKITEKQTKKGISVPILTQCPKGFLEGGFPLSIEMETGTGKTYVFLKTIFELNKQYGFKKFVIVVPSIAIREGVMKSIAVMRDHFSALYKNVPFKETLYDSKNPNELKYFAENNILSLLIINIDAFAKDENKINQAGERAFAPIEYLAQTNPIVIVDEAQNFETPIRQKALNNLNPLCRIFYSATHKEAQNLLYSLNPIEAYRQGLVKKIEVNGFEGRNDKNGAYLKIISIKPDKGIVTVEADKNGKDGVNRGRISLKIGDDLYSKTNKREAYQDNFILNEMGSESVRFANGIALKLGETQGGLNEDMMRLQIERTIAHHFEKLQLFKSKGIKVLSLFFIDKVANYRTKDENGEEVQGKFALWFEEIFEAYAKKYPDLIPYAPSEVHNGYFSGDKKGNWKDSTERGNADDNDTYALIMRDKERLLSLEEPLQFVFSHSALREGWDNPNVFQICTLNETHSTLKKRQEIGRGLRLCVNQKGERIHDDRINVLTVVPNESYEQFAKALQEEIAQEVSKNPEAGEESLPIKDARDRVKVRSEPLSHVERQLLHEIWERINYQANYRVALDSEKLKKRALKLFDDEGQYPKVKKADILSTTAFLNIKKTGQINATLTHQMARDAHLLQKSKLPDIYKYIQERVDITRQTICAILKESNRLGEFFDNPQAFMEMSVRILRTALLELITEGVKYEKNGKSYDISLLEADFITWASEIFPDISIEEGLKDTLLKAQKMMGRKAENVQKQCILRPDSSVEENFAQECAIDERVKFFFKLPQKYKIKTPLGNYNPDWAVVFEQEKRVYFVAETKSSLEEGDRRSHENFKIKCGQKFFALAKEKDVHYKVVTELNDLI